LNSKRFYDLADDESKSEFIFKGSGLLPNEWNSTQNPPYSYYIYYIYANLYTLNHLRQSRGFSTFSLRPHAGEAVRVVVVVVVVVVVFVCCCCFVVVVVIVVVFCLRASNYNIGICEPFGECISVG
jgi:hypothetical protein